MKAVRKLRSAGKTLEARCLEATIAGGATPGDRFGMNEVCPLCGEPDSAVHRYYLCSKLGDVADAALAEGEIDGAAALEMIRDDWIELGASGVKAAKIVSQLKKLV